MPLSIPHLDYNLAPQPVKPFDFGVRVSVSRMPRSGFYLWLTLSRATLEQLGWAPGRVTLGLYLGRDDHGLIRRGRVRELPEADGGRVLRATRMAGGSGQVSFTLPSDIHSARHLSHQRHFRATGPSGPGTLAELDVDLDGLLHPLHVQEPVT